MSAIEKIGAIASNEYLTGREVLELLVEAMLELAERQEGKTPVDAEPLIAKPGRYRERGGGVARVTRKRDVSHYSWAGFNSVGNDDTWASSGASSVLRESDNDLIAYIGPREEETAGLCGFITLTPNGRAWSGKAIDAKAASMDEPHIIIDLSTITKGQLVQPVKKDDYADMLCGRIVIKQIARGGYEVTWAGNGQPGERHVVALDVVRHLCPQAISQLDAAT